MNLFKLVCSTRPHRSNTWVLVYCFVQSARVRQWIPPGPALYLESLETEQAVPACAVGKHYLADSMLPVWIGTSILQLVLLRTIFYFWSNFSVIVIWSEQMPEASSHIAKALDGSFHPVVWVHWKPSLIPVAKSRSMQLCFRCTNCTTTAT